MSHAEKITRRQLLTTGATIAGGAVLTGILPGCDQSSPDAPPRERNMYDVLAKYDLRGQDGERVNIRALKQANSGKFSTMTFSFNGCGDYCPLTNASLGRIDKNNASLAHFVISVTPEMDGLSQNTRNGFRETFRRMGVKNDVTILYPKTGADAIKIQNDMGLIVNQENPALHSSQIVLSAPDGKVLDKKNGISSDNYEDWNKIMAGERAR